MKKKAKTIQSTNKLALSENESTSQAHTARQWRRTPFLQAFETPALRFSPVAWAKLEFQCHSGDSEIGGFGISSRDDLLLVEDFVTVKQRTTAVSVKFDDAAVAEFFEDQVDAGRTPEQFARIWLHTHPGDCPNPSATDEETFARVFGNCDWAIMCILAHGGQTYCRLRFNSGPGGSMDIPVAVDFSTPFTASDHIAWQREYEQSVYIEPLVTRNRLLTGSDDWELTEDPFAHEVDALLEDDMYEFEIESWEDDQCRI
ncbi:MAG: hypothetical protein DHS20C16_11240 [Phycisphaerae bacterium]|nr:MAG: hypothetical protein DHS20C16_11240 [Phycisphaerae bacterium]